jgi:hypothetical protein
LCNIDDKEKNMKEIRTEIRIESTKDKVWEILMDLPHWSEWNPIVNKIEGNLEVGGELSITMCDEKGKNTKNYKAKITSIDDKKRFSFIATMMANFMFSADRIIELEDSAEGTLLIQREIYTGIMVSMFWGKLSTQAKAMLNSMNEALKKKAEN